MMVTAPETTLERRARWDSARAALDPFRPQAHFVEMERAANGEMVFTATLFLTNRECPWRCVFCDLWKGTTLQSVPAGAIPAQIDFALEELRDAQCRQIKLYNAGSFFDPGAVPPSDFAAIAERVRRFERVIVESHPALVGPMAIRFRDLVEPGRLEVAMGLEIADDALLARMNKRMTLAMFRRAADFLRHNGIALRAFVIVKPPFVRSEFEAIDWANRSVSFAFDCGATVVSLVPARFGAAKLSLLAQRGEFAPPALASVEECLDAGIACRRGRVFVDLWDIDKLANCPCCGVGRVSRLREMNGKQIVLPRVSCTRESAGAAAG